MKKVLVYKSSLLPFSEVFIKKQVLALKHWHAMLVGERLVDKGLPLDGLEIQLLKPDSMPSLIWRVLSAANNLLQRPPAKKVITRLALQQAKLIHVHFGMEAVRAWPLAKELGLPLIVTLHGGDINIHREWWESGRGGFWMSKYPSQLLKAAHATDVYFVAVSRAIKQRAIEYGIPAEKIAVRYIGVDIREFSPGCLPVSRRKPRVLFVGRLVEKKGCFYLLKAFARITSDMPKAELVIIGDGPLHRQLEKMAKELKINVSFLGALPGEQIKQQMDEARVFCLPSVTRENGDAEGLGIVILEAQACGVPVITSARGGATEGIRHEVTGFAFPERDVDALTEYLRLLLTDDGLAMAMAEAGPRYMAECFDLDGCTTLLEDFYNEVVSMQEK